MYLQGLVVGIIVGVMLMYINHSFTLNRVHVQHLREKVTWGQGGSGATVLDRSCDCSGKVQAATEKMYQGDAAECQKELQAAQVGDSRSPGSLIILLTTHILFQDSFAADLKMM